MYSAKDFYKTNSTLEVSKANKLVHRRVLANGQLADFNKDRGHGIGIVDLPTKTLSMTVGHLLPNQKTRKHRHNYETLIYIMEGYGVSTIEDQKVYWEKGDAIYIPVWAWHQHSNLSEAEDCIYLACENTPLLQNLGGIALREEAK